MRAAFHLLVLVCLMWCALGIAEPAQAHVGAEDAAVSAGQSSWSLDHESGEPAAGHHHHCPVAPDVPVGRAQAQAAKYRDPVFAPRFVALASLTRAPPLQPPAFA